MTGQERGDRRNWSRCSIAFRGCRVGGEDRGLRFCRCAYTPAEAMGRGCIRRPPVSDPGGTRIAGLSRHPTAQSNKDEETHCEASL